MVSAVLVAALQAHTLINVTCLDHLTAEPRGGLPLRPVEVEADQTQHGDQTQRDRNHAPLWEWTTGHGFFPLLQGKIVIGQRHLCWGGKRSDTLQAVSTLR